MGPCCCTFETASWWLKSNPLMWACFVVWKNFEGILQQSPLFLGQKPWVFEVKVALRNGTAGQAAHNPAPKPDSR